MKKYRFWLVPAILLIMCLPAYASARDIALTLEYYHTNDKEIIDRIYLMELTNEQDKQKLYNDLMRADEGSKRTLNKLLKVFKWYHVNRFKKTLTLQSRVFSEDFIVPEKAISSRSIMISERQLDMISEKQLDITFNIKTRRKRSIPVGMNIIYDYRELFSDIPRYYPMDKLVLMHALNAENDGNETLEVLIIKLIHPEIEETEEIKETVQEEILLETQ